jgi:CHAT domain-containing protein
VADATRIVLANGVNRSAQGSDRVAAHFTGVVAARWAVPDKATLVFMAAFHRFLNAGSGDPAGALREAQLWMLDPAREVPATWPQPLRRQAARLSAFRSGTWLADAEAWAAFTYQGR